MPGMLSDVLAWVTILTFAGGALVADRDQERGRLVTAGAWVLFAVFWLQLIPHFAFVHKSYVEGILAIVAVPAALYAGKLLYEGRDSLFILSRAVAAMGIVYLPFETIPAIAAFGVTIPAPREVLIETVTVQVQFVLDALGYHPAVVQGTAGYDNTFRFMYEGNKPLLVSVVLACTGLGSMTIFAGLIAAVRAPLRRKIRALAIALPIIYALNIVRVTFIAIAFGKQYMQFFVEEVLFLFGGTDPYRVSFYLSDRVVSQLLAVVALVGVTFLVVRELPELLTVIEDVLYMVTGEEYDLEAVLDLPVDPVDQPERRPSD